jgi:hypothetical protein
MTKEIFNEFAGFLLIWIFAIAMIEYDGIWWLDIAGDVVGGIGLIIYAKK